LVEAPAKHKSFGALAHDGKIYRLTAKTIIPLDKYVQNKYIIHVSKEINNGN